MNNETANKTYSALEFKKLLSLLATYADTQLGTEAILALSPLPDTSSAQRENLRVELIRRYLDEDGSFDFHWLSQLDAEFFDYKAKNPLMEPALLYVVAKTLQEISANQQLLEAAAEEESQYQSLADLLPGDDWLAEEILSAVESDGSILDSASPELKSLRADYRKNRTRINTVLKRFFDQGEFPGLVQDDFISIRNDRAVIPIKVEHKNRYKGIIHDRSRSGDSVYFEPMEVVESNNALANLRAEIRLEEVRVLKRLTGQVYNKWDTISATLRNAAYLETLVARARIAADLEAVTPDFSEDGEFRILNARHPLIDERLQELRIKAGLDEEYTSQKIVPVDIRFNSEHQILIVTGPNAGGKTVTLKSAGLLAMMAQSGIHVPASDYHAPFFRTIAADIGDSQDISSHLSSFSSHLYWLRTVLQNMETPSLILVDEISAATDPGEGSALAMATLEYLYELGAFVMASTHLEALKAFAHSQEGMQNCSVEFDPDTLKPTYNLSYGLPGKSNALETAKEMKLPAALLKKAHYYMGDEGASISEIVSALQEQLDQLRSQERDAKIEHDRLADQRAKLEKKVQEQKQEANREIESIRKEWREYRKTHDRKLLEALEIARSGESAEKVRSKMKESIRQREEEFKELDLQKRQVEPETGEQTPLNKGQKVVLEATGRSGSVESDWEPGKDGVKVNFDGMRMTVPRESLRTSNARSETDGKGVQVTINTGQKRPESELLLVGQRVDDALDALESFLDDALVNNMREVRIIHGRGTGTLRSAVETQLKKHPMVENWRQGQATEGGTAVTVVTLAN